MDHILLLIALVIKTRDSTKRSRYPGLQKQSLLTVEFAFEDGDYLANGTEKRGFQLYKNDGQNHKICTQQNLGGSAPIKKLDLNSKANSDKDKKVGPKVTNLYFEKPRLWTGQSKDINKKVEPKRNIKPVRVKTKAIDPVKIDLGVTQGIDSLGSASLLPNTVTITESTTVTLAGITITDTFTEIVSTTITVIEPSGGSDGP